jgi:uroporphyrinogen decarboxylase
MNKLYNILSKKKSYDNPPIWIMRQAGRYLPEYRNLRKDVSDFLELCYNPKLASEVTLQPIKRFDFDAAIIFSDILVIPDALGVDVKFVKGEGPKLGKYKLSDLNIDNIENHLQPVFENLQLTRLNLDKGKDLIGFSGCPWTLACYMIEGGSSKNFDKIRRFAYENEQELHELFDILIEAIANYCILQIEAGANIIKLFDSWAGILPANQIDKWVIDPIKRIIAKIKNKHSEVPIIVFPKGLGVNYKKAALALNCEALAIDQTLNINWAKENLQNKEIDKVIQGNFDNFLLAFGSKKEIEEKALEILNNFKGKRFIFNLGHGILQETPIENVEFLVNLVKSYKG